MSRINKSLRQCVGSASRLRDIQGNRKRIRPIKKIILTDTVLDLPPEALKLWLYILFNADENGVLETTRGELAKAVGLTRQQVATIIRRLILQSTLKSTCNQRSTQLKVLDIGSYRVLQSTEKSTCNQLKNQSKEQETEKEPLPPPPPTKEKVKEKEKPPSKGATRFQKPDREEVQQYIQEKGYNVNTDVFYSYYESNGWRVGRNPMKNWRAAVAQWSARSNQQYGTNRTTNQPTTASEHLDRAAAAAYMDFERMRQEALAGRTDT